MEAYTARIRELTSVSRLRMLSSSNSVKLLLVVLGLVCLACDGVARRQGEPDNFMVSMDDPEMLQAMDSARASIASFIGHLGTPPATQSYTAIKVRLVEDDKVEHIWVSKPSFDGTLFRGALDNVPLDLKRVRVGDTVSAPRDSISDWMIIDRDTVFGAYTVHVLRRRMSPSDRSAFDGEQGVYFGDRPRSIAQSPDGGL